MKKDVFIPIRVDENDFVELTFEEFEELINEAYESGYEDGVASMSDVKKDFTPYEPYKSNPTYPYAWWGIYPPFSTPENPTGAPVWTCSTTGTPVPEVGTTTCEPNVDITTATAGPAESKSYIVPNGSLSFDECINFLKNKQKK